MNLGTTLFPHLNLPNTLFPKIPKYPSISDDFGTALEMISNKGVEAEIPCPKVHSSKSSYEDIRYAFTLASSQ